MHHLPTQHNLITTTNDDNNDEYQFAYAMEVINSAILPMVLKAAYELDVLEIIARVGAKTPIPLSEIANHINTQNPDAPAMLDRMLRLLTTYSILTCTVITKYDDSLSVPVHERRYSLGPGSKYLIRDEDGTSLGALLFLSHDRVYMDSWSKLKDQVIQGGSAFEKAHGANAFEYPSMDDRFSEVFNSAMFNHSNIIMKKIVNAYKGFQHLRQLVDVGGGTGVALKIITSKYPMIKGINFDLPHVIQNAPPHQGIDHVAGDMYQSIPSGEALFMKFILHDWSDEHCITILKNCHKALPNNGKVIVVDLIAPVVPDTSAATRSICQLDLLIMTHYPGGKERTLQEFVYLAQRTGFSGVALATTVYGFGIMELYKSETPSD